MKNIFQLFLIIFNLITFPASVVLLVYCFIQGVLNNEQSTMFWVVISYIYSSANLYFLFKNVFKDKKGEIKMAENEAIEILKNSYIEKFNNIVERIQDGDYEDLTELAKLSAKAEAYKDIIISILQAKELML